MAVIGIDLGTTNSLAAVSYTHLDVYKRQVQQHPEYKLTQGLPLLQYPSLVLFQIFRSIPHEAVKPFLHLSL